MSQPERDIRPVKGDAAAPREVIELLAGLNAAVRHLDALYDRAHEYGYGLGSSSGPQPGPASGGSVSPVERSFENSRKQRARNACVVATRDLRKAHKLLQGAMGELERGAGGKVTVWDRAKKPGEKSVLDDRTYGELVEAQSRRRARGEL